MTTQAEGCLAEPFLKFVAREWLSHIVHSLATNGTQRFGVLRRSLPPAISARVLSSRLKELESGGYIERRAVAGRVKTVEYSLTDSGRAIDAALRSAEQVLRVKK